MNHKTAWIIALIALPLLAAVFTLHAQKQDDGRDKQEHSFGVEKIYVNPLSKDAGAAVNPSPEEMERRKDEFTHQQPNTLSKMN